MTPLTDLQKVEEIVDLLRKARLLLAAIASPANDLDSLLSVAEGEARQFYASILYQDTKPEGVPVIMSKPAAPDEEQ